MYTESARLYDPIYFTFKNYRAEALELATILRQADPKCHTVLDVACGTGEHARLLTSEHGFLVDGIDLDPSMLAIAKKKNPQAHLEQADMTSFDLGRRYDAVVCLFGSIAYVNDQAGLTQAFGCFRNHVEAGGTIVVEPFLRPEDVQVDKAATSVTVDSEEARVTPTSKAEISGRQFRLFFDYRIEDRGGVRHSHELHNLALFTDEELEEAFTALGLAAVREDPGLSGRGIWIAKAVR